MLIKYCIIKKEVVMEKVINIIKKYENIFVILLLFISLIGVSFYINLDVNDELWNFQNVYKMYNGYQIYEDANVICTPLFFYIGNLLFKLFGANFFVFRIYNILIFLSFYFLIYKILRTIKVNMKISLGCILILLIFGDYSLVRVMANYNLLALVFSLFGIYFLIKNQIKMNNKNILIQSIICFLIIITKQNIGLFYLIALFATIIIKHKKESIKKILKICLILSIFSIVFVVYLYFKGILNGFINYTILGISDFANKNVSMNILYIFIGVVILISNLACSIFFIKQKKIEITEVEKNILIILNCFSIMLFLLIYPIINMSHLLLAISTAIILFVYICNIIIKKSNIILNKIKKIISIILLILIIYSLFTNINRLLCWINVISDDKYYYEYNSPYFGTIVSEDLYKNIENIINYIQEENEKGNKVIVFSSKASLYMVPLKQSNSFYDLPFNGNFGQLTEEDIIQDLIQKDNTLILVTKDENDVESQENKTIIKILKEKLKSIGTIEEFEILKP